MMTILVDILLFGGLAVLLWALFRDDHANDVWEKRCRLVKSDFGGAYDH